MFLALEGPDCIGIHAAQGKAWWISLLFGSLGDEDTANASRGAFALGFVAWIGESGKGERDALRFTGEVEWVCMVDSFLCRLGFAILLR